MKRIEITVATNGQARIETHGFSGESCREASRLLEKALGKSTSEALKTDFYATAVAENQQLQHPS